MTGYAQEAIAATSSNFYAPSFFSLLERRRFLAKSDEFLLPHFYGAIEVFASSQKTFISL